MQILLFHIKVGFWRRVTVLLTVCLGIMIGIFLITNDIGITLLSGLIYSGFMAVIFTRLAKVQTNDREV